MLALMAGLFGMVYAAFEHVADFTCWTTSTSKSSTCARNIEIAVWKRLPRRRRPAANSLLLSNELDPNNPNLS